LLRDILQSRRRRPGRSRRRYRHRPVGAAHRRQRQDTGGKNTALALFGFASSTHSIPAMPVVQGAKVPFFARFTGADAIRKQNDYVYTIRATYADEIEKLIGFWGPLGMTRVAVLHYDDEVGKQNFQTAAKSLDQFKSQPISIAIKRNVDISDADVESIIKADPKIILVTTSYAPLAQMQKKIKKLNKHYLVTSLSFAGASQIAKELGESAAGITVALTVPLPGDYNAAVVAECRDACAASGHSGEVTVTALEAYIAARVLVEGIKRAGHDVSRESLQKSLSALTRVDVGGFVVQFKPGFRHGGKYLDIAVITRSGRLQS